MADSTVDEQPLIGVIGAAHLDVEMHLLNGWVDAASNPVKRTEKTGGVAANVARQLARNCTTHLYTALGNDTQGDNIRQQLSQAGIVVKSVVSGCPTGVYVAVLEASGELRVGLADTAAIETISVQHLQKAGISFNELDAVCIDCNCEKSLITEICSLVDNVTKENQGVRGLIPGHRPLLVAVGVSPAKISKLFDHAQQIDILFANRAELAALTGNRSEASLETLVADLNKAGFRQIVATDGANNIIVLTDGKLHNLPVTAINEGDTTGSKKASVNGAGDALAGAAMGALFHGIPLLTAVRDYGIGAAAEHLSRTR